MSLGAVEIVRVDGLASFLSFCRAPRQFYKGQKGYAPPLDVERWTMHAGRLNPHFKHVDWQNFIARRNSKPVGRIMAQIYKEGGFVPVGASRAQFGCLDAIDDMDVIAALTGAAEDWLRERGAEVIHGPFSPSVNNEVGLLVEGFDATPMIFMPWTPPYLARAVEALGYVKARDLISYRYTITEKDRNANSSSIMNRPEWRDRLKIRQLDLRRLNDEAAVMVDIFNDAWKDNWGYVPFTLEEFMSAGEGLKLVMPPECGFMIELDGEVQAFGLIAPNLHELTGDLGGRLFPLGLPRFLWRLKFHTFKTGRLLLFGLRSALHRRAAGGVVILAFIEECRRRSAAGTNLEHVEFGWVLEDNMGMRRPIELSGAKIDKIHRIYEKKLL